MANVNMRDTLKRTLALTNFRPNRGTQIQPKFRQFRVIPLWDWFAQLILFDICFVKQPDAVLYAFSRERT